METWTSQGGFLEEVMPKKKTDVRLLETAYFRGVFCLDLTGRFLVPRANLEWAGISPNETQGVFLKSVLLISGISSRRDGCKERNKSPTKAV